MRRSTGGYKRSRQDASHKTTMPLYDAYGHPLGPLPPNAPNDPPEIAKLPKEDRSPESLGPLSPSQSKTKKLQNIIVRRGRELGVVGVLSPGLNLHVETHHFGFRQRHP